MSNQQIQKVKVKRLAHVGLWTTDILAQARFYRQVLGLDLRTISENFAQRDFELEDTSVFLSLADEYHCLGLFNDTRSTTSNGRKPIQRTPLHHLSFELDTDAELAALAARLKFSDIDLELRPRDGNSELGDTLWFHDPDGNLIEISVSPDDFQIPSPTAIKGQRGLLRPRGIQHIALRTMHLEDMVGFYTEALGFDISDWLLRECAWLRCNNNHHTLMFLLGNPGIDHIGYSVTDGPELLHWADHLGQRQVPILWGPGRHGAGNDLFLRFADSDDIHIELSSGIQQYYDHDATTPPRLWHTRSAAFNLWGSMPSWLYEEVQL